MRCHGQLRWLILTNAALHLLATQAMGEAKADLPPTLGSLPSSCSTILASTIRNPAVAQLRHKERHHHERQ